MHFYTLFCSCVRLGPSTGHPTLGEVGEHTVTDKVLSRWRGSGWGGGGFRASICPKYGLCWRLRGKEKENHGPAICPPIGWPKCVPGWKQNLTGNHPESLHQQETPTVPHPQEPFLEERMTPTPKRGWQRILLSVLSAQITMTCFIFASLIPQLLPLFRQTSLCVPVNLSHMIPRHMMLHAHMPSHHDSIKTIPALT